MLIYSDDHMHTSYSADCQSSMESMIESAIAKGLKSMTFTDHMDIDFPGVGLNWEVDYDRYIPHFQRLKKAYEQDIQLKLGVEVGLQHCCLDKINDFVNQYPFDFVLASTHVLLDMDPYQGVYYETRSKKEAYATYFNETRAYIEKYNNFDSYGHLDYIIRYAPYGDNTYDYQDFMDSIDPLLKTLIAHNKGMEINSSGYRKGLGSPHPQSQVIQRYYELGGRCITLGSDAHFPHDIGANFGEVYELLKSIGFDYITTFHNRQPQRIQLDDLL